MTKRTLSRRTLLASVAGSAIIAATGAFAADGIFVTAKQIEFTEDGRAIITSKELVEGLKADRKQTVALMKETMPSLKAGDIKVDPAGRILVNDKVAADALLGKIKIGKLNIICGGHCG